MNYNKRLAEIIGGVDDRTYKDTAETIKGSGIDCYGYFLEHNEKVPPLNGINHHAFRYGIGRLLEENNQNKNKDGLVPLISA